MLSRQLAGGMLTTSCSISLSLIPNGGSFHRDTGAGVTVWDMKCLGPKGSDLCSVLASNTEQGSIGMAPSNTEQGSIGMAPSNTERGNDPRAGGEGSRCLCLLGYHTWQQAGANQAGSNVTIITMTSYMYVCDNKIRQFCKLGYHDMHAAIWCILL